MTNSLVQLINSLAPDKKALLAEYLRPKPDPIAIIGMGCRFPGGVTSPESFWELLKQGRDTIIEIPADRWDINAFYDPNMDAPNKMYTRWGSFLEDAPYFDSRFFGIAPNEARRMDPQQRLLLEVAWQALEDAGLIVDQLARSLTGVFVGLMNNDYQLRQLRADGAGCSNDPHFGTGSSSSMAAGRIAYLFDLQGPTMTIDTACSSSLVATHLAVQSLQQRESNLALVGGVNVVVLPDTYINFCKMRMFASDGRCKTFDASADGFVMGEGCGFIVLKRLSDALSDGNHIRALIRGSAVNEDGRSSSITAPNGLAQQAVIRKALAVAGVEPHEIGYVEAHGSGTALGDPIELEAIRAALGPGRAVDAPLMVGTVKTNIGHLNAAAGIAGLMKTVLSLQHKVIPPHLNLKTLNPGIPLAGPPFTVPTSLTPWESAGAPRIAGVSSFGWSGTNAHVIVEEAPTPVKSAAVRPHQLLIWSTKTSTGVDKRARDLLAFLKDNRSLELADIAHTLRHKRQEFAYRQALVCSDTDEAIAILEQQSRGIARGHAAQRRPVAFIFPGVGDHYAGMAQELYASEPVFRDTVDQCCRILDPLLGTSLLEALFPVDRAQAPPSKPDVLGLFGRGAPATASGPLQQTALAQPAVFVVEYALTQLLRSWGIVPQALLGYSLGEYVAATVAGVLGLEDALRLVATRARLIQALPAGAMLAVNLSAVAVAPYLRAPVDLAVVTGPQACVLAGPVADLEAVAARLEQDEIAARWLATSHAFHSQMLAPLQAEVTALAATLRLAAPQIPYVSNVTGTWITAEQATDPGYWAAHMVQTVRFGDGVGVLLENPALVLVEVGPGQALGSFVRQHPACGRDRFNDVISTLPPQSHAQTELRHITQSLGHLWTAGAQINWAAFDAREQCRLTALPPYPFERQRFWFDLDDAQTGFESSIQRTLKHTDPATWFYKPVWERAALEAAPAPARSAAWLLFIDGVGIGDQLAQQLAQTGGTVIKVRPGAHNDRRRPHEYFIRPECSEDYLALLEQIASSDYDAVKIVHLWSLDPTEAGEAGFAATQRQGLYSLAALAGALSQVVFNAPVELSTICRAIARITGKETLNPNQATALGPILVLPQELAGIACRLIDTDFNETASPPLVEALAREIQATPTDVHVAYRNGQRWTRTLQPLRLERHSPPPLRHQGVYMITGGLGEIGFGLAEHLAKTVQAKLILVGRSALPERDQWDARLASHHIDDGVSVRIRRVQQLESLGADVGVFAADVADVPSLQTVIEQGSARFGQLNGVIHAAGIVDSTAFRGLHNSGPELYELHFQPKVYGLMALEQALESAPLDFCVIFSSISTVLGGLGFSAYVAANAFMDAFVQAKAGAWQSVNWDLWLSSADKIMPNGMGTTLTGYGMTLPEGIDAFERVLLAQDHRQIVNSTGSLDERLQQWVRADVSPAEQAPPVLYARPEMEIAYIAPRGEYEQRIAAIWQEVLGLEQIGIHDSFFDLGGNSLVAIQVIGKLKKAFNIQLATVTLFEAPTINTLATYLLDRQSATQRSQPKQTRRRTKRSTQNGSSDIAIIGVSGRFPGAASVDDLWELLIGEREALTTFDDAMLLAAGVKPSLLQDPNYVKKRPVLLDDVGLFDAAFFGYSPREAEFMDPQQRLFHECAWEALEMAGYDTQRYDGLIGVFAGASLSTYMMERITLPMFSDFSTDLSAYFSNDKDGLTTNVSYKLNLRGPSVAVQTYCSTSLVATHIACRALRAGECDIALAGGVSIRVPVTTGYLYREGDQVSPDGHSRTFDVEAGGANFGDGVAIIVLKRLEDALADGDTIHAVIRGSAINNDGGLKVGYTAPSVVGQSEAIIAALDDANVSADSITYVEAHGTATPLGDPIEIASLSKAFRASTDKVAFCGISSTKPNIGHLDRAAGVTGLIKTVMALKHEVIPPTLHFKVPNPEIDFADTPFYVLDKATPWRRNGQARRAIVNSLGVGGTNAHVVVEEAPLVANSSATRAAQLLVISAKTASALDAMTERLANFLERHPDVSLADAAYTLQIGRRIFDYRRIVVCDSRSTAIDLLHNADPRHVQSLYQRPTSRSLAFIFPGVGDHYAGMARELYASEPVFRATVDDCCRILDPLLGTSLLEALFPVDRAQAPPSKPGVLGLFGRGTPATASGPLQQTALAQPAVFVVEYALAQLLRSWGIVPQALLGYSLGEYVAATVAGVLGLEDALRLVATRARLIQALPAGAMLAVNLSEDAVAPYLRAPVDLAVVTGPQACVLAGPVADLEAVAARLERDEIAARWLTTSHAFHSQMLAPLQAEVTALAATLRLAAPQIPYVSNVTGTWITAEQATDPGYWAAHMVQTVRFGDGVGVLLENPALVLVEVGPGQALGSFVRQHPACGRERFGQVLATLPAEHDFASPLQTLLKALGHLWMLDVPIDWTQFISNEHRRRIPLPTYPFERQRFWLEPGPKNTVAAQADRLDMMSLPREAAKDWFYIPSWRQVSPRQPVLDIPETSTKSWIIFEDETGVGSFIAHQLRDANHRVISVRAGTAYGQDSPTSYIIDPSSRSDYNTLFAMLFKQGRPPTDIVHLWSVTPTLPQPLSALHHAAILETGFYSLVAMAQALGDLDLEGCQISVISNSMQSVTGLEDICPEKATLVGPVRLIQFEYAALSCRSIDIELHDGNDRQREIQLAYLLGELTHPQTDSFTALRGLRRWVQQLDRLEMPETANRPPPLRRGGVYLLTGGLGGIGLAMAEHLARTAQARLVLLGRSRMPERSDWPTILANRSSNLALAEKIEKVQALEALGSTVVLLQADVANAHDVHSAVQHTLSHFGALHGVIHAAGVPGVGLISLKTSAASAAVLAPKVQGTRALAEALSGIPLDFMVLFSSIASATGGGAGQVDYCAANAYLDAFAQRFQGDYGHVRSIGWCEWQWNAWDAAMDGYDNQTQAFFREYRQRFGLHFHEGIAAFERLLDQSFPHAYVATQDLRAIAHMLEHAKLDFLSQPETTENLHPRPNLGTSFIRPQTPLEQAIAAVWGERLGIAEIGLNDNFFELGGNSLIGIDLLNRLRKRLNITHIPAYALYEAPTVGALAKFIEPTEDSAKLMQERQDRGAKRRNRQTQLKRNS